MQVNKETRNIYDITCNRKNDSVSFFNMSYNNALEIIEDYRNSYILDIVNNYTNKKYKIINKQSLKDFINVESKNKEV